MKCENCIKADVCKKFPSSGIPPITRENIFKNLDVECGNFLDKNLCIGIPCAIGGTLYVLEDECTEEECCYYCEASVYNPCGYCMADKDEKLCKVQVHSVIQTNLNHILNSMQELGTTVFDTEESAVKAQDAINSCRLKGVQNENVKKIKNNC